MCFCGIYPDHTHLLFFFISVTNEKICEKPPRITQEINFIFHFSCAYRSVITLDNVQTTCRYFKHFVASIDLNVSEKSEYDQKIPHHILQTNPRHREEEPHYENGISSSVTR